ncbi:MAG: M48 family metallopeptidase [Bacteroidetes bacterium]|nr:M48 family metallopeptidase [Bacteroidota bacterium]MBM3424792.1 hypothetical protein [Bacteroidota bacterium]
MKYILLVGIFLLKAHLNAQTKKKITYDFSCLESSTTIWLADWEKEIISTLGVEATFTEEINVGLQVLDECKKEYTFISSGAEIDLLRGILNKLKLKIQKPRGFTYQIYYIDDPMVNAFTAGGKIFFTKGMYKFCKDKHEMAAILAHEIAHNELGHIRDNIAKSKTYDKYIGKHFGKFSVFVANILTLSFNQKNEAHCDMWGVDLARNTGYQTCQTISLWKRMQAKEGKENQSITSLLNTHPYSGRRADCVKNHLKTNYAIQCNE